MFRKARTLILASLLLGGSLAFGASPGFATQQHPPAPFNPDLTDTCGLDFILVLDRSGSIRNSADDLESAATGFLGALKDTGSKAAVVFAETASVDVAATAVTSGANLSALEAAITGLSYGGSTNWEDGLLKAQVAFDGLDDPLVVMITDGDPNRYFDPTPDYPGDIDGPGTGFSTTAFNAAKAVAEDIKGTAGDPGSHIFALGVGDINESSLKGIAGHDEWNGSNFASADWARINDFDGLTDALADIATELCGGTITVTKKVGDAAQEGWTFHANDHSKDTGGDGTAQFSFDNVQPLEIDLTEVVQEGYELAAVSCGDTATSNIAGGVTLTLGPEDIVTCTFDNRVLEAGISIAKTPSADTVLAGTEVTYTYAVTNTGQVSLSLVTVTDDKCAGVTLISGDDNHDDRLDLAETWTYQCASTITEDTTNVAVARGEPPVGKAVTDEASAHVDVINPLVEVDKSGPELAHEGDEIEFTITVTNTGDVPLFALMVSDELLDWSAVIDELPAGEENSVSFVVSYTVPADSEVVENTAEVCPKPVEQKGGLYPECDSDDHEVDVIHPAITIDKTADPTSIIGSGEVTFTYVVGNTGDVTLSDVVVTDDILGAIGTIDSLAPGAEATLTKTVSVDQESDTRNVGTATGTDPLGKSVSDDDDAEITVVAGATTTTTTTTTTTEPPTTTAQLPDPEPEPQTEVLGETIEQQPGATLPRTGSQVATTVLTGLGLVAGGLGFHWAGRRRRNRES